jgi:SagB-type dehydrogenase family enzyme
MVTERLQKMNDEAPWPAEKLREAFQAQKRRIEEQRRASFQPFGVPAECAWPASRIFHEHSMLGPAWMPILNAAEVEAFTLKLDYKQYPEAERIALPKTKPLHADLARVIQDRRSEREFSELPLTMTDLAKLLELGGGVTGSGAVPRRTAPSPGALYPVEIYPIVFAVDGLSPAVYHYAALSHELETVRPIEDIGAAKAFLPTDLSAARPALILALTSVFSRVQTKYLERGYRFALLEAGHIAQNILLAATALGLASVPIGGYWDEPFNSLLGISHDTEAVIYSVIVGRRR